MKTKILLWMLLVTLMGNVNAQLNLGDAVVTRTGTEPDEPVVRILPVGNPTNIMPGENWPFIEVEYSNWDAQNLGQVFGIALNNVSDPMKTFIYTTITQCYPNPPSVITYTNGYENINLGNPMQLGSALIWQLDATVPNGGVVELVSTDPNPALHLGTNRIFNRGTGIGNICYDPDHEQIFVTNFEDGKIYRIDGAAYTSANYGDVVSRYDPFGTFNCTSCPNPDPISVGRKEALWGIAYYNNRVYFSRWQEDIGSRQCLDNLGNPIQNEIYSVAIDDNPSNQTYGDFIGNLVVLGSADYAEASPQLEIALPPISSVADVDPPTNSCPYSNPVSDIEFSTDGKTMLLAERTMRGFSPGLLNGGNARDHAHRSRLLRYDVDNVGTWVISANNYYVGNLSIGWSNDYINSNCAGGTDFGYNTAPHSEPESCQQLIWSTGDALRGPGNVFSDNCHATPQTVYGIAGIPIQGNNRFNADCPSDPKSVNNTSYYRTAFTDNNGLLPDGQPPKDMVGDVDVYRGPITLIEPTVELDFEGEICIGEHFTFTITGPPGYWWGLGSEDSEPNCNDLEQIPPSGIVVEPGNINLPPGTYTACIYVYSENPCESEEYCVYEVCTDPIIVVFCECPDYCVDITHNPPVGTTYTFYNDNDGVAPGDCEEEDPTFITWFVDGEEMQITPGNGTFTHTFEPGTHVICMQAAYIYEDDHAHSHCCYYDDCEVIYIRGCEYWKANTDFTTTFGPVYNTVNVDFQSVFMGDATWGLTVLWDFGDNTPIVVTDGSNPPPHTYAQDGEYTICATVVWSLGPWDGSTNEACCCVTTICHDVEIEPCNQTYEIIEVPSTPLTSYTISPVPPPGATVQWFLDNNPIPIYTGLTYTPDALLPPVNHILVAVVIYAPGASNCPPETTPPLTFTIPGEGSRVMGYYPNPVRSILTLEIAAKHNETVQVQIYDYMGRPALSKTFYNLAEGTSNLTLDVLGLANGMYQMRLTLSDETKMIKVIKE